MIQNVESYVEGLLVGRGRMYRAEKRLLIEFPHKNIHLPGIAHCPDCGWLATGFSELKCKNRDCNKKVDPSVRRIYEQHLDTKKSLTEVIVPFISEYLDCEMRISPGNYSTHLFLDFPSNSRSWSQIQEDFPVGQSHHDFHIPESLVHRNYESKTEFINGLLDTAGFVNAGGWLPRDGINGHGRMRLYFQVVRNWPLVVEIDNFLRQQFQIPIQTIDWGHPNIRSAGGSESSGSATTREHQIKIFPEFMEEFQFRISCKQSLFSELLLHNKRVGFSQREDWFPPRVIPDSQRKATHKSEGDLRLPLKVRRHFDAFWQINLELGCTYLESMRQESVNAEVFSLTGDSDSDENLQALRRKLANLYSKIDAKSESSLDLKREISGKGRSTPEYDTYDPLRKWLESYLCKNFDKSSVAWITAEQNLTNFLAGIDHDALDLVENLDDLRIRPDIVGVIPSTGEFAFIESKVTNLNLREVGQLLGYCLVAQPRLAYLISTKPIDVHLAELIALHPALVEYGQDRRIELLHFDTNKMSEPRGVQNAK
jgi:hypothetical protein